MFRRLSPVALFLLLVSTSPAPVNASEQSLSLSAGVSTVYNSNFLEYSNNQLDRFKAGTNPLRFSLESTDDAIVSPGVSLTWELDQGSGRRHALRAHWDGDFHATNPGADYRSYSARWTESFSGGRRFAVGYGRMDHFFVRQLRDEDLPVLAGDARWQRAEFDQDAITASWRQDVGKGMNLGLAYRYETRDYVPAFVERSSKANQGEITLGWDGLPNRGELELSAGYRQTKADATDGDGISGDDDDVSYHGLLGGVKGDMQLSRSKSMRWTGDAGVDVATRSYDSDLPVAVDPFHAGRSDMLIGFEAGVRVDWKRWDARLFGRIENNTADLGTGAGAATSDSGSYPKNQIGLAVSWSGDLWKSGK